MVLYCLSLVFFFNINNIYIANVIYYILLLKQMIRDKGRIKLINGLKSRMFMFSFIVWVTITTFGYAIVNNYIDIRVFTQYFFTLQYIILIVILRINVKTFEKWIYIFSILFSIYILSIYIYLVISFPNIHFGDLKDNIIAEKLIPGWPNTTPIPLLIALGISIKQKKVLLPKVIFILALILTTSRGSYLGIALILGYFLLKKIKHNKQYITLVVAVILLLTCILTYLIFDNALFITQMTRFYDRSDIFNTTMAYVKINPVFGYGGNTIDQLQSVKIDYTPTKNWGHTHNWILEILLRYGAIGLVLFLGFIISLFTEIKDKDRKYLFVVFIFLALFQTFMRDFIFLFYLSYLSNNSDGNKDLTLVKY